MDYDYRFSLSSILPEQTPINHYLTNLRAWADWFVISQGEDYFSLRPDSKEKFFGCLVPNNIRILVVDDNREVRDLLDTLFTQCGFIVIMARDGLEALRKLDDSNFDIVLTDICMPGINGNILSRQIKKMSVNLPVIAITASPGLAENYFDEVLTKPFDLEYLLETVQNLLAGNSGHQSMTGLRHLKEKISNRKKKEQ